MEATDHFDILLEAPAKKKADNAETIRMRVTASTMRADQALEQPSILEEMTKKLRDTQTEFKTTISNVASTATQKASSGCLVVLLATLGAIAALIALVLFAPLPF